MKKQKLFLLALFTLIWPALSMLNGPFSILKAQTFVVVDKNGNKVSYDVSKINKIIFQEDPPGFTVYETKEAEAEAEPVVEQTTYTFDNVQTFLGAPDFLFSHPDTVYVGGETESFRFQLRTNVSYDFKTSDTWLRFSSVVEGTDSLQFQAGMNPSTTQRIGFIRFVNADETLCDTLWVVQAGKYDSRYIAIDWTTTSLNSYNEQSGEAKLTFAGEVPVMGKYDVVLLPKDGDYIIRLINEVQQAEGSKTVTLTTRDGVMGNLFKNTRFTLATEGGAHGAPKRAPASAYDDAPVYLPTKVEIFTGDEYVEIYDAAKTGRRKAPQGFENEFFNWEYNDDGRALWESGLQSLSWDKLNFNLGLKGKFSFDFGDIPWEDVRMGDLQNLKITLEGGFDMEMVLKYLVASQVEWKKEWTLKEDVFKAKYTFMVGTVPVYISVGADLMAEVSLGASGEASVTAGITSSNTVTYGVEWDAERGLSKIAECERNLEMVGPDVNIKAHAEARATCYPKIEIGIYKVLCPTISPQPYLKAEADGRLVDNKYVAWNAGVSTGVDLGLGLCLDLFFFKKDLGEIDPINVFDIPLVSLPEEIKLLNEPEEEVLINGKREVKYHVTHKINLTGKTYDAANVLVHFEAEGGELEDEYGYTDKDGNVTAFFTLNDLQGGKVKAEVVLGAEGEEDEDDEDAIKADDWTALAIDHRLTPSPASQDIEKGATAAIVYKLERYTSKTGEWSGYGGQTIEFEATGGTVAPTSGVTAPDGTVAVTFTPEEETAEGKVTGSVAGKDPDPWGKVSAATVKIKEEGGGDDLVIDDEGLKKAAKQKPNVYIVEDKSTGVIQTREYTQEWSEWNKDQDVISFSLEDADADGRTQGMIWGFIPLTMSDVVLALTGEQFANTPGAKFGFGLYVGGEVSGDFMSMTDMTEGNISPESRIMLHKVKSSSSNNAPRRAPGEDEYTGEYELLFYLVFKNQVWNSETNQMEEGDDYEIYGRGTMKMHLPTITSFQATPEKDWVRVGESTKVTVTQFYEENATWDWNDVQLIGQSTDYSLARNGEDEGFFSWDAATQTLTALKSNDNKRVYVCLGLISNPEVKHTLMIATGEGWKYTMITTSQEEITTDANSYPSFDFDWAPKESDDEQIDFNALELDPETDPNGYFQFPTSYASRGWPIWVSAQCPPGEYTLRFRVKSNHDVNCTMKFIITAE